MSELSIVNNAPPRNDYYRGKILDLEAAMIREFGEQTKDVDAVMPVRHYHCKGNYAREVYIPAGSFVIGKIHKHEHINVLSAGTCCVVTEAGKEYLSAPLTFVSLPGIKRAVYAIKDTVWTTIHPTDSQDLEQIEDEVIAKNYEELNNALEVIE